MKRALKVRTGVRAPAPTFAERKRSRDEFAMRAFPESSLPKTIAGRLEMADRLLNGIEIVDDEGRPTGERTAPMITKEQYLKIIDAPPLPEVPPLIVGPRCTMPVPCGTCWFCLTWPERRKQLRYERPWEPR